MDISKEKSFQTLAVLAVVSVIASFFWHTDYFRFLAISLLSIGLLAPGLGKRISVLWLKFGIILFRIKSGILLSIIFFTILTPAAFIRKFTKNKPLILNKKDKSYWKNRQYTFQKSDFGKTW